MSYIDFPATINKIAIFNGSHVTLELAEALLSTIRSVYPFPEMVNIVPFYSLYDETTLYIIICPAGFIDEENVQGPKYYITYQLEGTHVLTRPSYKKYLKEALYNWDYSRLNIKALTEMGIKAVYVPPGFDCTIASIDILRGEYLYNDAHKDIDVLFLGCDIYERRRKIKDALFISGLRIWFVTGLNPEQMKEAIKRSKICLNMRVMDDMQCLETIRLNLLLSNQACVVNESIDDPELEIYKDALISVPYDKLVETCVTLVANQDKRKEMAIKGYQWYRNKRIWSQIVDFNYLLPTTST